MKICINTCYGGFGLSEKGIDRYAELAGIKLYKEDDRFGRKNYFVEPEEFHKVHQEDRKNGNYTESNRLFFSDYDIERTDPILIQVVEELGEESWGEYAELKIVEIPDDLEYEIDDYDGRESIHERHRSWS